MMRIEGLPGIMQLIMIYSPFDRFDEAAHTSRSASFQELLSSASAADTESIDSAVLHFLLL